MPDMREKVEELIAEYRMIIKQLEEQYTNNNHYDNVKEVMMMRITTLNEVCCDLQSRLDELK